MKFIGPAEGKLEVINISRLSLLIIKNVISEGLHTVKEEQQLYMSTYASEHCQENGTRLFKSIYDFVRNK
jgi:hypothetical protein